MVSPAELLNARLLIGDDSATNGSLLERILRAPLFLAMIGSGFISGICGANMPLILKQLGANPVAVSSIFLTTATDVASMGMLLGLAMVLVT